MTNIESFNIAVAEVFGKCYQSFPLRINISIAEIGDTILDTLIPDNDIDLDLRRPEYAIAKESIGWLIDAGYLWHRNANNLTFNDVTLSPKGLEVLNATPKELKNKSSLGEELGKGIKEIGKDAALNFVKATLSHGAKLVLGT